MTTLMNLLAQELYPRFIQNAGSLDHHRLSFSQQELYDEYTIQDYEPDAAV